MLRTTKQKEIIQKELNKINTFFSAEELHEKVKNKEICLATVYRFLKEMRDNSQIYSYICDRKTIYSKENKSHCHFICEESGKIIHFEVNNIDFLKNKIPGKITSFQLEVKGICNDCSND